MSSFADSADQTPEKKNVKKVVKIVYNTYSDSFHSEDDGSISANLIDEEYCLSDVMPGCTIHLTRLTPAEYTKKAQSNPLFEYPLEKEEPVGKFCKLENGATYYVVVVQSPVQEEEDRTQLPGQWAKLQEKTEVESGKTDITGIPTPEEDRGFYDQSYAEFDNLQDVWGGEVEEDDQPPAPPTETLGETLKTAEQGDSREI